MVRDLTTNDLNSVARNFQAKKTFKEGLDLFQAKKGYILVTIC
jgi:hypothetical protein